MEDDGRQTMPRWGENEFEEKVILAFERDLQTGNSVESVHRNVVSI